MTKLRTMFRVMIMTCSLPALLATCENGDGLYAGGIQPSPAGHVNQFEPGFVNGSGGNTR